MSELKLLSPIRIGNLEVRNRVVSTAHSAFLDFFRPGSDGERYMAYQERRAEGGTGLIIMTAMHVHPTSQIPNHFVYEPDDMAPKFRKISSRVHAHGAKIISQLFHFGMQGKSESRDDYAPIWGFSPTVTQSGEAVHEMTDEEVEEIIDSFANAARCAVSNGIDGVELHGTHGYLIQQSFSPWANQRTDRWGEPLYFVKELGKRVRAAIGPDKLLGFRISADDFIKPEDGGVGHAKLCDYAGQIVRTGYFSYLNHSEGAGGAHYARAIASYRYPFGEYLPLTRGLREALGGLVPLIGVGKIPTPDLAERALQEGDCDLVGMTRAQIADPDLVNKVASGQTNRIRLCTGSNQGCFDRTGQFPITCIQNPEVGEERRFKALALDVITPKKVLVIGGGPAGIKAAEIAARRGHAVTLVDAGNRLGGRLNLVEPMGPASNLLGAVNWVTEELKLLGVRTIHDTRVDEAFVRDFKPDAIILATGAESVPVADFPTDGSVPVIASDDAAQGLFEGVNFEMAGTRAVVIDRRANYETNLVTEAVSKRGAALTIVTPYASSVVNTGTSHAIFYSAEFPRRGIETLGGHVPVGVSNGSLTVRHGITGRETTLPCDFIVSAVHPKPRNQLLDALKKYAPVKTAGDVVAPRSALEAFREGDRAGRTV